MAKSNPVISGFDLPDIDRYTSDRQYKNIKNIIGIKESNALTFCHNDSSVMESVYTVLFKIIRYA